MAEPSHSNESSRVPEAAIGSAGEALCESVPPDLELVGGTWIEDPLADEWAEWAAAAIEAALPAIHAEIRERLTGDDAIRAMHAFLFPGTEYTGRDEYPSLLGALEAALDVALGGE